MLVYVPCVKCRLLDCYLEEDDCVRAVIAHADELTDSGVLDAMDSDRVVEWGDGYTEFRFGGEKRYAAHFRIHEDSDSDRVYMTVHASSHTGSKRSWLPVSYAIDCTEDVVDMGGFFSSHPASWLYEEDETDLK